MMKVLLAAVNAKYIHSNLGVYSLKAYADKWLKEEVQIEIGEYTINHQRERILQDIYKRRPDIVGFSCYIWNIAEIRALAEDLPKVLPDTAIWLGGPEVSYDACSVLERLPQAAGVMNGEGEETFTELLRAYEKAGAYREALTGTGREPELSGIRGLTWRDQRGEIHQNPPRPPLDMSMIPFAYKDLTDFKNRIIYYESSRGCPFSCSYCLSSIDKSVRFRDIDLVKKELDFFLEKRPPQVKFVDRTFNCKKDHAMAIWKHILEHDNGITNFHFEIAADILDEEELDLLAKMRPGLVQLEIGVQTVNPHTIREIRRKMDLDKVEAVVNRINAGKNIHQHLDLIAGLPFENLESFCSSFNRVYRMRPQQLQLGFLKVLKGSYMEEQKDAYGLSFTGEPPYEVLSTRWLSYGDVILLKTVEEMTEIYYNSGQFSHTIEAMEKEFDQPFDLYLALAQWYQRQQGAGDSQSRLNRFEHLFGFIKDRLKDSAEEYRDKLMLDLYLRENAKSRPSFARDQTPYKEAVKDFFIREEKERKYLRGYEGRDSRQMAKMAHMEVMGDGTGILFDYENRDPLTKNAGTVILKGFAGI